ncbi:virulence-associated E family protein [Streptococcus oralis]|uniref:virulence-associated E family protein n=1 Tax=Streptococcus oralis TaxID=1303 RepID=UPI0020C925FD|nr:virulence-associated E family protein [Streptococcus oralis]MCP9037484.1 virulence-associated E family protein [Streptococcus oralis]MCP9052939.1 virulence-associated E family protein [Streptococcus oralis]MCP9057970.1 virulence-associated E family protein [Streptococcus oralis]MCP9065203.1 virulence-associated E family protein [Streptococcus oralis]MCP9069764.1 virulence-associated E family protein [Streptococcus oralis]
MILNDKGAIKSNSPMNVLASFKADDQLSLYLKHNEFSQEHELLKDIKIGNTFFKKGELPSNFDSVVKVYFESVLGVAYSNQALLDGMETFFSERSYNPVIEYMEKAAEKWDGRKRIDRMLQVYLGAEDIPLVSKIAQMWLVGAVAKVYDPFVKFDYVLDLVGGQGVGKTSLLQKLGGEWYTDAVTDFANKDNYDIMLKSLIVNDDEMVASKRMSFAETKAFISKTSLRFRKPYMKRTEEFAKNFVLARTTNQKEYLKDKTGERRFLPVLANIEKQKKHPMEIEPETIEQIWGEAVTIYRAGADLMFDKKTEEELEVYRETFMYRDEVELQVLEYLEMPIPDNWSSWSIQQQHQYTSKYFDNSSEFEPGKNKLTNVSTREMMYNLFMRNSNDKKLSTKINMIMDNHPEWQKGQFRIGGKNTKGFKRIIQK